MTDLNELRKIADELREAAREAAYERHVVEWDKALAEQMLTRAADTIDALVKEMHARELHHFEEEQKSAGLAAEVGRLRLVHAGQARLAMSAVFLADTDDDEGVQAFRAEWVKEHDARLIEELADTIAQGWRVDLDRLWKPKQNELWVAWLRERARQVREGEA